MKAQCYIITPTGDNILQKLTPCLATTCTTWS